MKRFESRQTTIREAVRWEGVGLHSGEESCVILHPAPVSTGIVFCEGKSSERFRATLDRVIDTHLATTLGNRQFQVSTVEHLLSAVRGLEIDNLFIEVFGGEIPILDGSARAFVQEITSVGIVEQDVPRSYLRIKEPVSVRDPGRRAVLLPSDEFEITYSIHFDHKWVQDQSFYGSLHPTTYRTEIASARTFGFLSEVNRLRSIGLTRGGSLHNAIVIGEFGVLNPDGLRYPDEFVRHKVLDAIGDFALLGYPLLGHLVADQTGHGTHFALMMALYQNPSAWEITTEVPISQRLHSPQESDSPLTSINA